MGAQIRLYEELGSLLHKTVALIDREADRALRSAVGVSLSQYMVLRCINDAAGNDASQPHASQQSVANSLGINKAAVSRHIDQLVELGLIVRTVSPVSKRQNMLFLTDEGQQALHASQQVMEATMERHYLAGGEESARRLMAALKLISKSLERNGRDSSRRS